MRVKVILINGQMMLTFILNRGISHTHTDPAEEIHDELESWHRSLCVERIGNGL